MFLSRPAGDLLVWGGTTPTSQSTSLPMVEWRARAEASSSFVADGGSKALNHEGSPSIAAETFSLGLAKSFYASLRSHFDRPAEIESRSWLRTGEPGGPLRVAAPGVGRKRAGFRARWGHAARCSCCLIFQRISCWIIISPPIDSFFTSIS